MSSAYTDPALHKLEREKNKLQKDIENLAKAKTESFREHSVMATNYKRERESLKAEVDQLREEKEELSGTITSAKQGVRNYTQDAINKVALEIEEKRKRLADLYTRLEQRDKDLASRIAEYDTKLEEITALKEILNTRAVSLNAKQVDLDERDKNTAKIVRDAKTAVSTLQGRKDDLVNEIVGLEKRQQQTKDTLDIFEKNYRTKSKELEDRERDVKLRERVISDTMEEIKQKENELALKEEWLKDREDTLARNLKEFNKKNGAGQQQGT